MRRNSSGRNWAKIALLTVAGALVGCAARELPTTAPWSTHLYSYARTNNTEAALKLPLAVAWDKDLSEFRLLRPFPEEELSSPALAHGQLYAGAANNRLYAIDLATGKVRWKFDAGAPIEASPAVTEDSVCFGSSDGLMRCLDRSGKLLWQYEARSEILSSPVIRNGKLFFNSSDNRAYALDAGTGKRIWTYSRVTFKVVTPRFYGSPAYSDNGKLLFLFSDGVLASIDAETGREEWTRKVISEFDGPGGLWRRTPLVEGGTVYVIDGNNAVLALSVDKGEVKGSYGPVKARDFIINGGALVLAGETELVSIDRGSGGILWKKTLAKGTLSSVFAAQGNIFAISSFKKAPFGIDYFARQLGYIEAFDLKDGSTAWTSTIDSDVSANASSAYSSVALLTNKGKLTVFGPK